MSCGYDNTFAPKPMGTAHLSELTELSMAAKPKQEITISDPEAEGIRLPKPLETSK